MATVTCQCCGRTLEGARATRKYCAECRLAVRRENSRLRTIRKKRKKTHLDLVDEIALEVQAYNDNRHHPGGVQAGPAGQRGFLSQR